MKSHTKCEKLGIKSVLGTSFQSHPFSTQRHKQNWKVTDSFLFILFIMLLKAENVQNIQYVFL